MRIILWLEKSFMLICFFFYMNYKYKAISPQKKCYWIPTLLYITEEETALEHIIKSLENTTMKCEGTHFDSHVPHTFVIFGASVSLAGTLWSPKIGIKYTKKMFFLYPGWLGQEENLPHLVVALPWQFAAETYKILRLCALKAYDWAIAGKVSSIHEGKRKLTAYLYAFQLYIFLFTFRCNHTSRPCMRSSGTVTPMLQAAIISAAISLPWRNNWSVWSVVAAAIAYFTWLCRHPSSSKWLWTLKTFA